MPNKHGQDVYPAFVQPFTVNIFTVNLDHLRGKDKKLN